MNEFSVVCNSCENKFVVNESSIKEDRFEYLGSVYSLLYFGCPKCNKVYPVIILDSENSFLRSEIVELRERIDRVKSKNNKKAVARLTKILDVKIQRYKKNLSNLKRKFPGTFTLKEVEVEKEKKLILNYSEE